MIDIKELRLGNKVVRRSAEHEILTVDIDLFIKISRHCVFFNPIELTEELLVRFGFKPFSKDWSIKGLIIHTRKRGFIVNKRIKQLKHVHQLQNLYFALTGEELNFKD